MKIRLKVTTPGVILCMLCVLLVACDRGHTREKTAQILGDYKFDQRGDGAGVYLAHIFEKEGEPNALFETSDHPFRLEPDTSVENRFSVSTGRGNLFSWILQMS